MSNLNLTSEQQARSLRALRMDTKRELLAELDEINDELRVIDKYIQSCYDSKQGDLFKGELG